MAHNLARWTARIGLGQQIVTTKTLRRRFFALAGRLTRSARRFTLHLPQRWPWETQFSRALARLRAIPLPARRPAADPTSPPTRASPGPRSPLPVSYPAISLSTATAGRQRRPQKRLQTARQPPILPEFEPGSSRLQLPHPLPLSSHPPSLSIGGFGVNRHQGTVWHRVCRAIISKGCGEQSGSYSWANGRDSKSLTRRVTSS